MPQDREECLVRRNQLYRRSSGASARVEVPVVTREPSEERFSCEWRLDGTWEKNNAFLRDRIRVRADRDPQPSAGILDTQSVKTTSVGGVRGYDGAKKPSGRKRHLVVDALGMVLKARVHSADLQDRAAVPVVLEGAAEEFPRLEHLWVDQGYTGAGKA